MPTETCFDDAGRICACVTWTQLYVNLQAKHVFHSKEIIILFLSASLFHFFRYSFQYRRNYIRPSTQYIHFLQKIGRLDCHLFGAMHITLRGFRFVDVGIIYRILGKVLFQISLTNYKNILAHNAALATSGKSELPRLNSSRKSSDIPLPTQSPICVNPMEPITLSFGKKCYTFYPKRAFIECMFLPHRLRSLHQGYFPDQIDQHDQHSVPTGIHVNETRSQRD